MLVLSTLIATNSSTHDRDMVFFLVSKTMLMRAESLLNERCNRFGLTGQSNCTRNTLGRNSTRLCVRSCRCINSRHLNCVPLNVISFVCLIVWANCACKLRCCWQTNFNADSKHDSLTKRLRNRDARRKWKGNVLVRKDSCMLLWTI
jgi:hypothetical protein